MGEAKPNTGTATALLGPDDAVGFMLALVTANHGDAHRCEQALRELNPHVTTEGLAAAILAMPDLDPVTKLRWLHWSVTPYVGMESYGHTDKNHYEAHDNDQSPYGGWGRDEAIPSPQHLQADLRGVADLLRGAGIHPASLVLPFRYGTSNRKAGQRADGVPLEHNRLTLGRRLGLEGAVLDWVASPDRDSKGIPVPGGDFGLDPMALAGMVFPEHVTLAHYPLATLPSGWVVGGDLELRNCPVLRDLPDDLEVVGNLVVWICPALSGLRKPKGCQRIVLMAEAPHRRSSISSSTIPPPDGCLTTPALVLLQAERIRALEADVAALRKLLPA
jgi:hypothetical protein